MTADQALGATRPLNAQNPVRRCGGTLRILGPNGVQNTGLAVAPNTSPSIAADSAGGWGIAFTNADQHVATYSSTGQVVSTTAGVKAGTNPAITALSTSRNLAVFKSVGSPSGTFTGQADQGCCVLRWRDEGFAPVSCAVADVPDWK